MVFLLGFFVFLILVNEYFGVALLFLVNVFGVVCKDIFTKRAVFVGLSCSKSILSKEDRRTKSHQTYGR